MVDTNRDLKIIMLALRGNGKTSLLAAMHEEFPKTFEQAGLQTWVDEEDERTLRAIEECKADLRNIGTRLQRKVTPTQPKDNPWSDQGFVFYLGSGGRKFMKLRFTDPAGEYFSPYAKPEQKDYVKAQLKECDAVIIPVDATAIMQRKTGKVSTTEIGPWHEEKNNPQRITQLLKEAYQNVQSPRFIILAPIKCETYTKTPRDTEDLLEHVKIGYRELLDFLKSDSVFNKVAVVVTPVHTIGNVVFHYHKIDDAGIVNFHYHKTPINAPYQPKDGDQPLRYILTFLTNVFLENEKEALQRKQEELIRLQSTMYQQKGDLETAEVELRQAQQILEERQKTWWIVRWIPDLLFGDAQGHYYYAKERVEEKKDTVRELESDVTVTGQEVKATQEQIETFSKALITFANGCKYQDGFAIIQGRKWLKNIRTD